MKQCDCDLGLHKYNWFDWNLVRCRIGATRNLKWYKLTCLIHIICSTVLCSHFEVCAILFFLSITCSSLQSSTSTLEGNVALLLKGSGVEKGSIFVVFLKKSSDEALNGSVSLNGSPPKGSAAGMIHLRHLLITHLNCCAEFPPQTA